ncbi:MAG TPA: hypothetical protein VGB78_08025 [Thermoplasmata archaeon]
MLNSIKVGSVDNSLRLDSQSTVTMGGRILKVHSKKVGGFATPTRPISIPELRAKTMLPFNGAIEGHLGAVQIDLDRERFDRFKKQNGTIEQTKRRATKFSNQTCCFDNFAILDVPPIPLDDLGLLKLFLDVQSRIVMLDYISLPLIVGNDIVRFEHLVREWITCAEERGKGLVPQLSMKDDLDSFRKRLSLLSEMAESGDIQIINLVYANPERFTLQFIEVWKKQETKAIFNCSSVPSKGQEVAPGIHETPLVQLQKFGIDTITPIRKTPTRTTVAWLQSRERPKSINEIDNFSWAHHPAGAILDKDLWKRLPSKSIECHCSVCRDRNQQSLVDEYAYDERGEIVSYGMYSAARIHDVVSSAPECSLIQQHIKKGEMADYVGDLRNYRNTKLGIRRS